MTKITINTREKWKKIKYIVVDNIRYKISSNYSISNHGRLRNDRTDFVRNLYVCDDGYMRVIFMTTTGIEKATYIHRLVADAFIDNPKNLPKVNHKDNNRSNNYYKNLEWCTQKYNVQYSILYGNRNNKGEDNVCSKFTNSQITNICIELENNYNNSLNKTYSNILDDCNIEITNKNLDILTKIKTGKLWTHISKDYNFGEIKNRTKQIDYSIYIMIK